MQQSTQNNAQKIAQLTQMKLAENLTSTFFPDENLTPEFHSLLLTALRYNSIARLQCEPNAYENLIYHNRPFTMAEMYLAIGVLKAATPIEMGQTLEENFEMLRTHIDHTMTAWNVIYTDLEKKCHNEVSAKVRAGIQVVPSLEIAGLKNKKN